MGTPDSLEARLASEAGIEFFAVPAKAYDRGKRWTLVSAGWTTFVSTFKCLRILRYFRPDVVIAFGGYVSLPVGFAALLCGVPLVLHEQNAVPGLANRVLSRWSDATCVTYPGSLSGLVRPSHAVVTGNPVREAVAASDRESGRKALGLRKGDLVLLVFGGSRGARHINEAMVALYPRLKERKKLRIVHIAGAEEIEAVRTALTGIAGAVPDWWRLYDYIEGIGDAIAAADLVVCRAGATTLAELAAIGRPAVLVPYPYATDDHQARNAAALVAAGAASLVYDADLDNAAFGDEVVKLLGRPKAREEMAVAAASMARPFAAHAIAEVALEQAAKHRERAGEGGQDAGPAEDGAP